MAPFSTRTPTPARTVACRCRTSLYASDSWVRFVSVIGSLSRYCQTQRETYANLELIHEGAPKKMAQKLPKGVT